MFKDLFKNEVGEEIDDDSNVKTALAVNIQFQPNSKLLQGFWEALEKDLIK